MQRLVVKNIGPIKEINLEVPNFLILAGRQASGKSTLAKLISFAKSTQTYLSQSLLDVDNTVDLRINDLLDRLSLDFTSHFGSFISEASKFQIQGYGFDTQVEILGGIPRFSLDSKERNKLKDLFNIATATFGEALGRPINIKNLDVFNDFLSEKANGRITLSQQIFIPANRNTVTATPYLNSEAFTDSFRYYIEQVKNSYRTGSIQVKRHQNKAQSKTSEALIELAKSLENRILKGHFTHSDFKNYISPSGSDNKIPLEQASSGQQESIWISEILYWTLIFEKKMDIFIEEPEAHLFPEGQRLMAQLIALHFKALDSKAVVTTHSPYLLEAFNNLMVAHRMGQTKPDEVAAKIPKECWLDGSHVGAYFLEDGKMIDAIDPELGEIDSNLIDEASNTINQEYDFLQSLVDYE